MHQIDNATGRAVARQKAGQIDKDIAAGYFDPTLLKYRPQILGKNATVISCPELFERFMRTMEREKKLSIWLNAPLRLRPVPLKAMFRRKRRYGTGTTER